MHVISTHELPAYVAASPAIPEDKDRSEVRVYASVVTGGALWSMLTAAYFTMDGFGSILGRVAREQGHPSILATLFILAGVLLIPHLIDLLFRPEKLGNMGPRKMSCGAMVLAAVLWGMLATEAKPMGLGLIPLTYWASAVGNLLVGGAFGYSLNAQQGRQKRYENSPEFG